MSVCPRCDHPNEDVMMICTRCGGSLRRDRPGGQAKSFYARVGLWLILGVLLVVFVFLIMLYTDNVNKLAP